MKSWKTTLAGVGVILAAIGNAIGQFVAGGVAAVDFTVLIGGISAGGGLLLARDNDVSSKDVGIK
jgi:hypothetical protein